MSLYQDSHLGSFWEVLAHRIALEPLNLTVSLLFLCAIVHTFLAPRFLAISKKIQARHERRHEQASKANEGDATSVNFWAEVFHFLGEIEIPFGLWVLPVIVAISISKGFETAELYVNKGVHFNEAIFVVVVMVISATRPIIHLAESTLRFMATRLGASPAAWWFCILTVGPLLGSLVTEPAAMTVAGMLLARQFYTLKPSLLLAYLTLGVLFVNVSIGGTLTHFAAPPVLMVAGKWGWDLLFMFEHFGWKAVLSLVLINVSVLLVFAKEFRRLKNEQSQRSVSERDEKIPSFVIVGHLVFLAWSVFSVHNPAFLVGGFLLFIGFTRATAPYQNELALRSALLVGFFLAGLLVHGGLQAWWIEPLLSRSGDSMLFFGSLLLSALNDNAAVTYLASFAPELDEQMKFLVVAGAVCGGGLTVIANAPNPVGYSILSKYFPDGIAPISLALGALFPTIVAAVVFIAL